MNIETIAVGTFEANCFVVWQKPAQALVIDPGADAAEIASFLDSRDLHVAAYLLTHGHMDHISGLAELHATRPAPIALHGADLSWAFEPDNQMPPFYAAPSRPDGEMREIEDGQTFEVGGLSYHVLSTPGHTPGSVCFLFPEQEALFSGDTLFAGSVGRTDLPRGESRTLTSSLRKLGALPGSTAIFPGHGPGSRMQRELETNFFMQNLRTGDASA